MPSVVYIRVKTLLLMQTRLTTFKNVSCLIGLYCNREWVSIPIPQSWQPVNTNYHVNNYHKSQQDNRIRAMAEHLIRTSTDQIQKKPTLWRYQRCSALFCLVKWRFWLKWAERDIYVASYNLFSSKMLRHWIRIKIRTLTYTI